MCVCQEIVKNCFCLVHCLQLKIRIFFLPELYKSVLDYSDDVLKDCNT